MPRTDRLRFMDTTGGENSRQSRFELEDGEVRELVNLLPGKVATPRGGCPLVAEMSRDIDWVYPFRDNTGLNISIAKSGVDLVQVSRFGLIEIVRAGAFPTPYANPCAVRLGEALLVTCDQESAVQGWIITFDGTLVARPANLRRPDSTKLVASQDFASTAGYVDAARKARKFATTWVIRQDADGLDGANQPITTETWGGAVAESWEDVDDRLIYPGVDAEGTLALTLAVTVSSIPVGATHLRLWVSQGTAWDGAGNPGNSQSIASGSYARYWKDIAISDAVFGVTGFVFTAILDLTEGQLAGQTHIVDTTGASEIPPSSILKYHNGLLWAAGGPSLSSPGRAYYSLDVSDPPSRTLTLFDPLNRALDTSIEGTEVTMGIASTHGHLLFLNEQDVWMLKNGDPENEPLKIAEGMGTTFPNTVIEQGQRVWYLSEQGPAMISDGVVSLVEKFNVGHVWPLCDIGPNAPVGYFFSLNREERRKVRSWWKDGIWYISNGARTAAMKTEQNELQGGFQFELSPQAGFHPYLVSKFSEKEVYAFGDKKMARWASPGVTTDGASGRFVARYVSRPVRIDGRRREKLGEVWDILCHLAWNDQGDLYTSCVSQGGRRNQVFKYDQRPITQILQNTDINNDWRGLIQQGVLEGLVGNWFEVGFRKTIYDAFEFQGMEIGVILRDGHEMEYVSVTSMEEPTVPLADDLLIYDLSMNRGHHG